MLGDLFLVPQQRAGLAVGCYFGAFGAEMSLFDWFILPVDPISVSWKATLSAIAFTIAGGVILGSYLVPTKESYLIGFNIILTS